MASLKDSKITSKEIEKEKKLNTSLVVVSVIFVVLALGLLITVLVLPKLTEVPDVKIPNVANMTVAEAEKALNDLGFVISTNVEYRTDNSIDADKVIGIKNYSEGDIVKKGKTIILLVSTGSDQIEIEDYTGQKYQEVKASLERSGLQVIIETQATQNEDKYKEDVIVKQSIEEGTKLTKGDIIRLYIETLEVLYPDFKTYSLSGVQDFCDKNDVTLNVKYKETTLKDPGTILSQDRAVGNVVRAGTTLTIEVAKVPENALDPESASESETNE